MKYEELSDEAKERARSWFAEATSDIFEEDAEFILDDIRREIEEKFGDLDVEFEYSIGYYQGAYAGFTLPQQFMAEKDLKATQSYHKLKDKIAAIKIDDSKASPVMTDTLSDTDIMTIRDDIDEITDEIALDMVIAGSIEVLDNPQIFYVEFDDYGMEGTVDSFLNENYYESYDELVDEVTAALDDYRVDLEEEIKDILEDIAGDFKKKMFDEYDYVTSDEYLEEGIIANDYDFDENGKLI